MHRKLSILSILLLFILAGCSAESPVGQTFQPKAKELSLENLSIEQQDAAVLAVTESILALVPDDNLPESGITGEAVIEIVPAAEKYQLVNLLIEKCNQLLSADSGSELEHTVALSDAFAKDNSYPEISLTYYTLAVQHFCPFNSGKLNELINALDRESEG